MYEGLENIPSCNSDWVREDSCNKICLVLDIVQKPRSSYVLKRNYPNKFLSKPEKSAFRPRWLLCFNAAGDPGILFHTICKLGLEAAAPEDDFGRQHLDPVLRPLS